MAEKEVAKVRMDKFFRSVLAIIISVAIVILISFYSLAFCEETEYETVYVLCNPESYVNIRESPNKKSFRIGFAYCGDDFRTDGTTRNGFIHVFAGTETGDGWISTGYIVYSKPEVVNDTWFVDSNGRVAARSTIGGKRTRWIKKGSDIEVYYIAEVAVTNKGFVDAKYLSPKGMD